MESRGLPIGVSGAKQEFRYDKQGLKRGADNVEKSQTSFWRTCAPPSSFSLLLLLGVQA